MRAVTLLTDFGTRDSYVAALKGVILSGSPDVQLIDLSHDIDPGDRTAAYLLLSEVWSCFPDGTVHLAVVDPGVGTDRKRIVAEAGGHLFVGPDNGIFGFACDLPSPRFGEISGEFNSSATFEGRDVFAVTVARICRGIPLATLTRDLTSIRRMDLPAPEIGSRKVLGEVISIDRFGNLISNIRCSDLPVEGLVKIGQGKPLRWVRTYAEGKKREPVALWNSSGRLEISVRNGSARGILRGNRGMKITVEKQP